MIDLLTLSRNHSLSTTEREGPFPGDMDKTQNGRLFSGDAFRGRRGSRRGRGDGPDGSSIPLFVIGPQ